MLYALRLSATSTRSLIRHARLVPSQVVDAWPGYESIGTKRLPRTQQRDMPNASIELSTLRLLFGSLPV